MALLIGTGVCTKLKWSHEWNPRSATWSSCEWSRPLRRINTTLRFGRFYLPFSLCQTRAPFAQYARGRLAVGMRGCLTHGIAVFTGISSFSGVTNNGVKFFNFLERNIMNFPVLMCNLYLAFFHLPLLLCFLLSTFGQRRAHFWPNRFWSWCDWIFGPSAIYPWITLAWTNVDDAESRGSVPTLRENSVFTNFPNITNDGLFKIVQIGFCFSHDVLVFSEEIGNDDSFFTYNYFPVITWWR